MMAPIKRAGAGHGVRAVEQPVHDEGVEDEDDAEHGLPQMNGLCS